VTTPCRSCQQPRRAGQYLCRDCWYQLPAHTRSALNRRGGGAIGRLSELYAQITEGVPLAEIEVAP
jgi:hypothetical protein